MIRLMFMLAWVLAFPSLATAQAPAPHTQRAPGMGRTAQALTAGPALIDVNSADEKALDSLPGVGPARAKAIVANRPYADKQDLVAKKAVPANVLAQIEDKIALVNVNTATAAAMAKILPNVGPVRAQKIVDMRPYAAAQEMVTKGALTQGVFDGVKGLVTTGS